MCDACALCSRCMATNALLECACPLAGGKSRDKAGAVAIRQPYLRVIGFQEDVLNGDTARTPVFRCACSACMSACGA